MSAACGWNGCNQPKADDEDRCEEHEFSQCATEDCDGDAEGADSYDGYCGNCADALDEKGHWG